ncbi:MAG: HDIG domain-containing protein [Coriobacteriia bacterium]|nr:HDIG domain-containing protein [Coriobacteriia bacterium]
MIPTREQARELVEQYNAEEFLRSHAMIVAGVMEWFAREHDAGNEEYWYITGLLHDIDYEQYPEEHCVKGEELLQSHDIDQSLVQSAMSHGWQMTGTPYQPEHIMEKILYGIDELTGLIGATAVMRPSGSVDDLEVKSLKKKYKQPSFAAGVSRECIQLGAEMLGWELDFLMEQTIMAMRSLDIVA